MNVESYTKSTPIGAVVWLTEPQKVRIYPRALLEEPQYGDSWLSIPENGSFELVETTSLGACTQATYGKSTQVADLQGLYALSGLTWKQLATLFGVDVRMIHYWLSEERVMSQEYADLVTQLVRLIHILDCGPTYKTRKFFEENIVNNRGLLLFLKKRDFASLERWAHNKTRESSPTKLAIAPEFLLARGPSRPVFGSPHSISSVDVPSADGGRLAKVRRKRKSREKG